MVGTSITNETSRKLKHAAQIAVQLLKHRTRNACRARPLRIDVPHSRALTAEREAARDVVQEAWLAIVRGLKRLDDPARFRSWAYRIVSNKCIDWTRRRARRRSVTKDLQDAAASTAGRSSEETDSTGEVDRMREALSNLPDEQRAMLPLHYLDGMGVAEIARALDVPEGTVKSRLYHARNRLKQAMERVKT